MFYKYSVENMAFDFIGKVDDDCYVDIDKLLAELRRKLNDYHSRDSIWLGSFRINWLVDRWGKWREEEYPSLADSSRWICDDSCHPEMIVSAQNDELKLKEL